MPISITTPTARLKLDTRDKPYFSRISDALHIGYKKGKSVTRWIVRWRIASGYVSRTLNGVVPDDQFPANNQTVLNFDQALERIMVMNMEDTKTTTKHCGLCGKAEHEVNALVTGVNTLVCDLCIEQSANILSTFSAASLESVGPGTVEVLLNPGIDFKIDSSQFESLINATAFAMAEEDSRTYLRGLLLEFDRTSITMVASNGHLLTKANTSVAANHKASKPLSDNLQHMIIPKDEVVLLRDYLASVSNQTVIVTVKDNRLLISVENSEKSLTHTTPLLLGSYPNYRDVIPQHGQSIDLNKADVLTYLNLMEDQADEYILTLTISSGKFTLRGIGDQVLEIDIDYKGKTIETGFNYQYLKNIFNVLKGEQVKLSFKDRQYVWRLESPSDFSTTYVLMPVAIWND